MIQDRIGNDYFEWLLDLVCGDRTSSAISFRKLLMRLHSIPFRYSILKDENRAADGEGMRYRFAYDYPGIENADEYLDGPCSVLEMMVALAVRCEESIMDDPEVGNRTGQWFWGMVVNLGLGSMTDDRFDIRYVDDVIQTFLDRDYRPDGKGGLFTVRHCDKDLRDIEIWIQMLWYINTIA